jgi:threonine dehydrogenase-like Zn-dependent dehydrogenase
MRALRLDSSGLVLRDIDRPAFDDECLIRVVRAGICGTDLQMLEGYAEFRGTPGHEFVGVVEAVGNTRDRAWIGKRVVGEINVGCGRCRSCASGVKEHCETRTVVGIRGRDGAFADFLTLPAANLHEVPAAIDDDAAVFVEPTAAACRIFEQITVAPDARVAVLGDGRMALLVAQVLRTAASDVIVLGRHDAKLAVARALGLSARHSDEPLTSPSARFDIVVDVTGRAEGMRRSIELVRPRGTVVLKSTFHGEASFPSWPLVVDEVTLVGSRCGPFARATELLASGAVDVRPLISNTLPLEDFEAAFAQARTRLKVLFVIGRADASRSTG